MADHFCTGCGARLKEGAQFCTECGARIPDSFPESKKSVSPKKSSPLIPVLLIVAVIGVLAFFVHQMLQPKLYPEDGPAPVSDVSVTQPSRTPSPSAAASSDSAAEYYPDGDPEFSDFGWYYDDIYQNGVPKDASSMTLSDLNGPWKYMFSFDHENRMNSKMEEIGYMQIAQYADKATLTPFPMFMLYESGEIEKEDAESVGYEAFVGTADQYGLHLTGNECTLEMSTYYEYKGKQYACGSLVTSEGVMADVLLVRP